MTATEKRVDAMPSAVKELVGDHEVERLMLFFQRTDRRHGNDALDSQLLESVNVGAKIQLARQEFVAARVARQESNFAPFERAQNVCVRRIAKRRLLAHFVYVAVTRACDTNHCPR